MDIELKVLTQRNEYRALYRRLRDDKMLRPLFLYCTQEELMNEEGFVEYFGYKERLLLAGFIDHDFVGCLLVVPFGGYLGGVGEFGVFCTRKWVKKKEEIRALYRAGLRWCFERLDNCKTLVTVVPEVNRHARLATEYFGAKFLCTIPNYVYWAEKDKYISANLYINLPEDVATVSAYYKEK